MGTVLISKVCHYCGGKATTEDHIVPRADLPKPLSRLPYWFRSQNVVPACLDCNGRKDCLRSDCTCPHCEWAWNTAIKCFLPPGYRPRGYISIAHEGWKVG